MYKDKDKQREADKVRQRRYRRDRKGVTPKGVTQDVTDMIKDVRENGGEYSFKTVEGEIQDVHYTKPKRGKDIKCFADLPPDVQVSIYKMSIVDGKTDQTIKANRTAVAIHYQHVFPGRYHATGDVEFTCLMTQAKPGIVCRVSKPGDEDYDGICTPEWIEQRKIA